MSDASRSPSDPSIRGGWLTAMYTANVLVSGPIGAVALLAPDTFRAIMGLPPQDPIHFGIASGAVPLAFGLAGVWGLRAPLTAAPVLLLQIGYKALFLLGVALPLTLSGDFPGHAVPIVGIFVAFIIGNSIAVPFSSLLDRNVPSQRP